MKIRGKYLIVLISACGMIASGIGLQTNVSGLFFTPVASSMHMERGAVALTLTISNLVYACSGLLTGHIIHEGNFRKISFLLTAVLSGSTMVMGTAQNAMTLYVCSALRGFAGGIMGFVLATGILNAWFHASAGLFTSVVMSVSGVVSALLSPLLSSLIVSYGWRFGYVFTGILMALCNLPLIFLLPSLKPEDSGNVPFGEKEETEMETKALPDQEHQIYPIHYPMVFLYAFLACAVTALPQHFPSIAESAGLTAEKGALMLSAAMIANTFGKIIMGFLIDRIGTKTSVLLYAFLTGAGIVMILTGAGGMMTAGAFCIGLSYSLGTVGVVMLTKDTFGRKGYEKTYPVISFGGTIGNALYSSGIGFLYDLSGSYDITLRLTLVFVCIAIMAVLFCGRRKPHAIMIKSV